LQIAVLGETVMITVVTVTVPCPVEVQPLASLPVTVYVMLDVGFAVTDEPVVALSAVAGLHEYVFAPLAVSVADCPLQIVAEVTVTTGSGLTFTVTCVDAVQPFTSVPVTVYVVVEVGLAVTGEPVVELSAVDGVHK
jgi:hypothetical protein